MMTASFKTYAGPGRISIARWEPRGTPAGYRRYTALAPRRDMLRMPEDQYREKYFREILGPLDPKVVWDELHELAGGAEPVLLCWERTPFSAENWCHRRMVADWFSREIHRIVLEHHPNPIFPGKTLPKVQ